MISGHCPKCLLSTQAQLVLCSLHHGRKICSKKILQWLIAPLLLIPLNILAVLKEKKKERLSWKTPTHLQAWFKVLLALIANNDWWTQKWSRIYSINWAKTFRRRHLFSVFRVVQGEAKTPKIMGCCRANFAFLHALKIGTFRGKWTLEWVIRTSHFVLLALYFLITSKLAFFLIASQRCLARTAKNVWVRAQNSAKNNFLPLRLEAHLAWTFLFLCSFLNNYPWTSDKKFVFQQGMNIKSEAKTKKLGVAGWKVGQTWHRNICSHAKKYNKNIETLLAKQIFSLLIWDRQLKFMLQHPTVRFDRKQLKYLSKELLLYDFLHKRSTNAWKTVTNSACRPLY